MGKITKTIKKEYEYGKILEHIPGFIRFICLYECYDDSSDRLPRRICVGEKIDVNKKTVLLMPYYKLGSIRTYHWKLTEVSILKSLLKQFW